MESTTKNAAAMGGIDLTENTGAEAQNIEAIVAAVRAELTKEHDATVAELKAKLAVVEKEKADALAKQMADNHAAGANESHSSTKERWSISIDESPDENAVDPVFVQINGRGYSMKRGRVVEVPKEVLGVLDCAVENKSIPRSTPAGLPNGYTVRRARRFPYQNFGKCIDAKGGRLEVSLPKEEPQE